MCTRTFRVSRALRSRRVAKVAASVSQQAGDTGLADPCYAHDGDGLAVATGEVCDHTDGGYPTAGESFIDASSLHHAMPLLGIAFFLGGGGGICVERCKMKSTVSDDTGERLHCRKGLKHTFAQRSWQCRCLLKTNRNATLPPHAQSFHSPSPLLASLSNPPTSSLPAVPALVSLNMRVHASMAWALAFTVCLSFYRRRRFR